MKDRLYLKAKLIETLAASHLFYEDNIYEQLIHYLFLLEKWNRVINLTGIKDIKKMISHHILDSLSVTPYLYGKNIIDVGTGAGLPGIPLALTQKNYKFFLLDSNEKKITFLKYVKQALNIFHLTIIQSDVKLFKPDNCFDTVVTRAFGTLAVFLKKTKHLCCNQGQWLSMKGQYPAEELAEINQNLITSSVVTLNIPRVNAARHIVIMKRFFKSRTELNRKINDS